MKTFTYEFQSPFTKEELESFIKKFDQGLPKLGTLGKKPASEQTYRIANGTWVNDLTDNVSERFKKIVSGITGLPVENQESPHFVRYEVGGKYDIHSDYFVPNTDHYEKCIKRGGQRVFSTILYLNDNFDGGETEFPDLNLKIKPFQGKIFSWRNMTLDGQLYKESRHAGLPVVSGVKYILIIWTREKKFV